MATTNPNSPLTPAVFHILLALSSGERHGYGIMKQVEVDSQGNVKMGAGTLYGSLKIRPLISLVRPSERHMNNYLRKLRGVMGIGLIWAPVWTAMFFALAAIIFAVFNPNGGVDVGPLTWILIIAQVGFVSGVLTPVRDAVNPSTESVT